MKGKESANPLSKCLWQCPILGPKVKNDLDRGKQICYIPLRKEAMDREEF